MLFGRKKPVTAREAADAAREHLTPQTWAHAASGRLCCVYTSVDESSGVVDREGRCREWHVDFYSPDGNEAYLVRVKDGKTKGKTKFAKSDARWPGVEYTYACYGSFPRNVELEPPALPDEWADSDRAAAAAYGAVEERLGDEVRQRGYAPLCYVVPAACLSYLQPDRFGELLKEPAPAALSVAVLMSPEDVDAADSFAVYVDAASGALAAVEQFQFPELFHHGHSADW